MSDPEFVNKAIEVQQKLFEAQTTIRQQAAKIEQMKTAIRHGMAESASNPGRLLLDDKSIIAIGLAALDDQ